jgi:hypothetical protein
MSLRGSIAESLFAEEDKEKAGMCGYLVPGLILWLN